MAAQKQRVAMQNMIEPVKLMSLRRKQTVDLIKKPMQSLRYMLAIVFESQRFEVALSLLITLNLAFLVIETDGYVDDSSGTDWASKVNMAFSVVYTVEVLLRIFTFGFSVFTDPWTIADMCIVTIDDVFWVLTASGIQMPSASMMRLLRLLRMARSRKLCLLVPEFYIQTQCLMGSLRQLIWGVMFMLFLLLVFAIIAVNVIHPINTEVAATGVYVDCARCPYAYESVPKAMLTLTQNLVAGDSWGQVTIPIIEYSPFTVLYFVLAFSAIVFSCMNVILAAVVDSANSARTMNDALMAEERIKMRKTAMREFDAVCRSLDTDDSGLLSRDEIFQGALENKEFANILLRLDLDRQDMDAIWGILDADKSGYVDFREFAQALYKMRCGDTHTNLVFMRHYVGEIRVKVHEQMGILRDEILRRLDDTLGMLAKEEKEIAEFRALQTKNSRTVENLENLMKDAHELQKWPSFASSSALKKEQSRWSSEHPSALNREQSRWSSERPSGEGLVEGLDERGLQNGSCHSMLNEQDKRVIEEMFDPQSEDTRPAENQLRKIPPVPSSEPFLGKRVMPIAPLEITTRSKQEDVMRGGDKAVTSECNGELVLSQPHTLAKDVKHTLAKDVKGAEYTQDEHRTALASTSNAAARMRRAKSSLY